MTDADDLYRALLSSGRLTELRRLTYRCHAARCLLLDAVETPLGVVIHQSRYKLSAAEHPGAARPSSTTFDSRHFKPRTGYRHGGGVRVFYVPTQEGVMPIPAPDAHADIHCDHVIGHLAAPDFDDDWSAGHAEVRVRPDGSRYAVT